MGLHKKIVFGETRLGDYPHHNTEQTWARQWSCSISCRRFRYMNTQFFFGTCATLKLCLKPKLASFRPSGTFRIKVTYWVSDQFFKLKQQYSSFSVESITRRICFWDSGTGFIA